MSIEQRLSDLGITLPEAAAPAANYVPYVVSGSTVYISGQLPMADGKISSIGPVTVDVTEEQASEAAKVCGINIIAQLKTACGGDLSRVKRIVKLGGFVNCPAGWGGQPAIINGASNLMVDVFSDAGRHARFAVGTNALPFNATVEIDCIAEIEA